MIAVAYHQEHYEMLVKVCVSVERKVIFCAAKLINYFQRWRAWKIAHQRTEWIYHKLKDLRVAFNGEHSLHCIRAAIATLIDAGILERRNNPGNRQDRTWQYRVNLEALNAAVSEPKLEDSQSNSQDSVVENQPYNPTTESKHLIPSKAEGGKNQEPDLLGQGEKVSSHSKVKSPPALGKMGRKDDIPQELKSKLEELSIPLDNRVRRAIASHHISQAYGAIAHIENTWESISNPRGVFLFQINKQPIEPMGSRGREYKASDESGYTLEHIKSLYPNSWREAARHFGLMVEGEQK
jgi:hypothetical protein